MSGIVRDLTFLEATDGAEENETTGFAVAFAILAAASFISVIQGIYETSRKHLFDRYSLKILFPWASFVQVLENATLSLDVSGQDIPSWWAYVVYALQATVPPSLLLSTFDVTYSIHKTRSIQFCGVYDGHTRTKDPIRSCLLKTAMRAIAVCLLAIGIVVNFNVVEPSNTVAGRVGWYYIITEAWTDDHLHVLLGVIPIGVASLFSFYFSIALWRYGTTYSMVVHASPCNPWFSPFFGTMALCGCQFFGPKWFPLLSNLGIFVFVESVLLMFMEVNKDMEAANDLRNFLDAIDGRRAELTGRKTSTTEPSKPADQDTVEDVENNRRQTINGIDRQGN